MFNAPPCSEPFFLCTLLHSNKRDHIACQKFWTWLSNLFMVLLIDGLNSYSSSTFNKLIIWLCVFEWQWRTMRKLKFHEKKLLKKVNFLEWKREGGHRENLIMQRYHVTGRDDYKKYYLYLPMLPTYLVVCYDRLFWFWYWCCCF